MGSDFSEDLKAALSAIQKGGIILYPTDTIWGIGCDARNSEAVKRIFDLKKRADSKSMLVLVDSEASLEKLTDDIPEVAYQLIEAAVNPITIIYDGAHNVAPELIAEDGSLGIRITREDFSRSLCRLMRAPLVSTSANISGAPSPSNFSEISDSIIKGVDYVVKYRQDDNGKATPSNIIKLGNGGLVTIMR
ncbi:MAG: threonylcarbamoyl-AMP synthase [Muribaculaceae bacterium]|nr:threonylcarbamoyl-AMP synthase [Muribaculaceae bacterium]